MHCVDGCMFLGQGNTICTFYGLSLSMEKGAPVRCTECVQDEMDYKADELIKNVTEELG